MVTDLGTQEVLLSSLLLLFATPRLKVAGCFLDMFGCSVGGLLLPRDFAAPLPMVAFLPDAAGETSYW